MKTPCTYIFLPTEKESNIWLNPSNNTLFYFGKNIMTAIKKLYKTHHLYILSEEEIREGDWYLGATNQIKKANTKELASFASIVTACKKIIATTNPELHEKWVSIPVGEFGHGKYEKDVPPISPSDIEYIISLYNRKGKEIDNIEDRKIVAAQQYALSKCGAGEMSSLTKVKLAWENGFETAQLLSDNADKKFTEEDMLEAFRIGKNGYRIIELNKRMESKQPKSNTVMVEYEEVIGSIKLVDGGKNYLKVYKPTIKDGFIVISREEFCSCGIWAWGSINGKYECAKCGFPRNSDLNNPKI